ncbi:MAG: ribosome recycling factor [Gemmatimonadota bacterium]|nr:ribosome recycling factor [Gemmatimonadota bacterium]
MLEEVIEAVKEAMDKAIESLRRDLASIRTGRASAAMLDNVRVDYYGQQTPLNQVATISVPEPRLLAIKPWEATLIPVIEKAILADKSLGLNPANDGIIIRLPIPELTEERRVEITKVARHRAEEGRVAVRHARRDGIDLLQQAQKDGDISEDESRSAQKRVQELTAEYVASIDGIIENKEKEIMEV